MYPMSDTRLRPPPKHALSSHSTTTVATKGNFLGTDEGHLLLWFGSVEESWVGAEVGLEIFSGECERRIGYESGVYKSQLIHLLQSSHCSFQRRVLNLHLLTATTRSLDQSELMLDRRYDRLLAMGDRRFYFGNFLHSEGTDLSRSGIFVVSRIHSGLPYGSHQPTAKDHQHSVQAQEGRSSLQSPERLWVLGHQQDGRTILRNPLIPETKLVPSCIRSHRTSPLRPVLAS